MARMTSRSRFGAFVYTVATQVATRAASGGTSASTTMVCRRYLLGGRLSHGREDRIRVSGVAAGLASSPRQQPTQTPEEPNKCARQGLGLTRLPRRLATRLLPRGRQHLLPAGAHGHRGEGLPLTRGFPTLTHNRSVMTVRDAACSARDDLLGEQAGHRSTRASPA